MPAGTHSNSASSVQADSAADLLKLCAGGIESRNVPPSSLPGLNALPPSLNWMEVACTDTGLFFTERPQWSDSALLLLTRLFQFAIQLQSSRTEHVMNVGSVAFLYIITRSGKLIAMRRCNFDKWLSALLLYNRPTQTLQSASGHVRGRVCFYPQVCRWIFSMFLPNHMVDPTPLINAQCRWEVQLFCLFIIRF